jgi:fructose-1,6-bisphosphatase I
MIKPTNFSNFIGFDCTEDAQLQTMLNNMCGAAIEISNKLTTCNFAHMQVGNGDLNVHGEYQQFMDVFADRQFLKALKESKACSMVISEEQPDIIRFDSNPGSIIPPFMVAMDPLDGSSNVAVNVPVGSIFSIFKKTGSSELAQEEALRCGKEQIAAGYFLYGTNTILIFAFGNQVNGFTLEKASNEFVLSHSQIKIPEKGTIYAVNDANYLSFGRGAQNFLRYCRQQAEVADQPFTARYSGSLVSDIHRILLSGGIFLYPETAKSPNGKLRLAYECFPMAYIVESAGGLATSGCRRILDITLDSIHQRSPIVAGSADLVITADRFINTSIPSLYEFERQT